MRVLFAISDISFPNFEYKKTAVKCSIYNSLVSKVIQFWIELSKRNCIKDADRNQGFSKKKKKYPKRVRDTSLWKFHHTDGREVWGISPMCSDIGSACYSCHEFGTTIVIPNRKLYRINRKYIYLQHLFIVDSV